LRTRLMATFQEAANYKKPESATLAA